MRKSGMQKFWPQIKMPQKRCLLSCRPCLDIKEAAKLNKSGDIRRY